MKENKKHNEKTDLIEIILVVMMMMMMMMIR